MPQKLDGYDIGKIKPVFVVAGAFLLLSPLSVATGLSISEPAKYLRLASTVLIVGLWSATGARRCRLGRASSALLVFVTFFTLAALWSDLPQWALFHKGMFAITCLCGMALAFAARTQDDFRKGLRFLGVVSAVAAVIAFVTYLRNPDEATSLDRLAPWGMNANAIGQTAAALMILCVYLALNDFSRFWKIGMIGPCMLLAVIVIGTGSRGAALMAAVGVTFILLPLTNRPHVLLTAMAIGVLAGYCAFEVLDMRGGDRLINELDKTSREGIWRFGLKTFLAAPIVGHGWLHSDTRWASVQNMFLQTLVETGISGAVLLGGALTTISAHVVRLHRRLLATRLPTEFSFLAMAFLGSVLVHGMAESSTLMGSTLNALFLGLGVGLADRVWEFATAAQHRLLLSQRAWLTSALPVQDGGLRLGGAHLAETQA